MMQIKFHLINLSLFLLPSAALAQTNGGLTNFGTATNLGTDVPIIETVANIINIVLGFLGVIVVVGIIYGGFLMMTSAGNEERTGQGRKIVAAGVIGLVIILAAYAIAQFVVGNLINETGGNI